MSASTWHSLIGAWSYKGGTGPGTVTVPLGAVVVQIIAHANPASSVQIFGGDTVALPPNDVWRAQFMHANVVSQQGANTIVFGANTTSYFVEYVQSNPA